MLVRLFLLATLLRAVGRINGFNGTAATALTFLGPIGAVMDAVGIDLLGVGDSGSEYGNAVLGRQEDGTYKIESESSKNKGFQQYNTRSSHCWCHSKRT